MDFTKREAFWVCCLTAGLLFAPAGAAAECHADAITTNYRATDANRYSVAFDVDASPCNNGCAGRVGYVIKYRYAHGPSGVGDLETRSAVPYRIDPGNSGTHVSDNVVVGAGYDPQVVVDDVGIDNVECYGS